MSTPVPAIILGGTGYVAGELLRLVLGHPRLELAAIASDSQPGEPVADAFPHLAAACGDLRYASLEQAIGKAAGSPRSAVLAAAPHGVSHKLLDTLLTRAAAAGSRPAVVDISADFRFADAGEYARVYKHAHGAPARLAEFTCAVPEHLDHAPTPHVAHPGCFSTATLLASVPLLALELIEPQIFVSAVTGSTGAGRTPIAGTHHPQRHSDLYAYNVLTHRHAAEITALARAATGRAARFAFVPHSGPFARGIHATVQARLTKRLDTGTAIAALRNFYAGRPFVRVLDEPPRIKDVVASNYAHLSAVADGETIVVMSVVDNLVKGAAGGALQWMNRLLGFDETDGLLSPAPGWT
ncbi:MAG TPA: N-acetyl-gamma-glutamyl-phosphate reductase [Steroidobacteraceae bacterium]|nr:N-acetyl-gamma-glutamyl-phosphate reductase [Steroidobacteraceae bacterium]